jgi:hypothetical protein
MRWHLQNLGYVTLLHFYHFSGKKATVQLFVLVNCEVGGRQLSPKKLPTCIENVEDSDGFLGTSKEDSQVVKSF